MNVEKSVIAITGAGGGPSLHEHLGGSAYDPAG